MCIWLAFYCFTLFPPLHEMLYASHVEFFAEVLEFFTHAMFHLIVVHKMVSSSASGRGPKGQMAQGAKSRL
jgi:hypothetical protein